MLNKVRNATLYLFGLLLPLFFLPEVFADSFGLPKVLLLAAGVVALLLLWAYGVYRQNALSWRSTPFDLPVLGLGAAYVVSTLAASPNKIAALASPAGSGVILLLVLFYFLTVQLVKRQSFNQLLITGQIHAALLLSVWTLANLGMELANFQFSIFNFQFPLATLSPMGSLLTQVVFLGIMLAYLSFKYVFKNKPTASNLEPTAVGLLTITSVGVLATIYKLMQTDVFPLLPYPFGWAIALDAFKNAPIFGVGPANFLSAFTRFKPVAINATEYWNVTFGLSSNWYLHLLATVGLLGLGAYLFLAYRIWRANPRTSNLEPRTWATLLFILIAQLFFPFNLPLLFTEFAFLAALGAQTAGEPVLVRLVTAKEGLVKLRTEKREREENS